MLPIKFYIEHPQVPLLTLLQKTGFLFPDKAYLKLFYRLKMGRRLDLKEPQRYTEKIQWLKLYDRQPLYSTIVDKYAVKPYISKIIGENYIIPTIGVWNKPEEINWDALPDQFVLKTTNGGGGSGVVICKEKSKLIIQHTIRVLKESLKNDLYGRLREWPYKNVPPRVIAEKYMEDESGELRDYKFYCFNGEPKVMLLASNRFTSHNFNYYDMDFNLLPINSSMGAGSNKTFNRPEKFDEMKSLAGVLSKGFPHVRVDLYCINAQVYFGELTLYDSSGYDNLSSDAEDLRWGSWMDLPSK